MQHHLPLRNKLIIMGSVMASLFLVALDQTIIATALGRIVEDFNAFDSLSWIVTAYLLTTTITVPLAGKLSDLFGRRIMLLIGVVVFGITSLASGMSGSIEQLVLWRAIQGIGGGIITANAFTIIGDLFAARERGRWQGLFGAVFGLASVIGPLLGGWLTEGHGLFGVTTDWRWTFYINVPIAIVAFALIAIYCPTLRHSKRPKVDYRGAALLSLALATLVLAVDNTEQIFADLLASTGLSLTGLRIIMFAIAIVATGWFIAVQRRAAEPILPLHLFANHNFALIMGVSTLFGAGFMGAILYLTQFNQQVFGASPTESGLMLLPMVGGIMTSSVISGQIISRTGKYLIFMKTGIVVAAVMIGLMTTLTPDSTYAYEAVLMALLGLGLGCVMPVMNIAVQNEFKQHELGVATSSVQLFRGLGSTIGIALFGALLTSGMVAQASQIAETPYLRQLSRSPEVSRVGNVAETDTQIVLNSHEMKSQITTGFTDGVQHLPAPARDAALQQFRAQQDEFSSKVTHAFSDSLRGIFTTSAGLLSLAVILVFMLRERQLGVARQGETPGEV